MGVNPVEVQKTDRYFVFGAPATSCRVNWHTSKQPKASTATGEVSGAARRSVPKSTSPAKMASEGSAASAVSVGARKVLPEDVLLVAVHGARVDLHPASLDKACPAVSCKPPRGGDAAFEVRWELQLLSAEK